MIIHFLRHLFNDQSHSTSKPKPVLKSLTPSFLQSFNIVIFLFLLITFAFSPFTASFGQVKIKEKVEITPKKGISVKGFSSTTASEYYPCGPWISNTDYSNPWQVVWIGSSHPLDPAQQAFNYQDNDLRINGIYQEYSAVGTQKIEILEGADKCQLLETFRCDSVSGECPDPISQDLGTIINDATYQDIVGEGDYMIIQGIPTRIASGYVRYGVRFIKEGDVTLRYTDLGSGFVINFHTRVVKPDYYLEYTGVGEIPHGEEDEADIRSNPIQCTGAWEYADTFGVFNELWNGGSLPDDVKFNVSIIEGAEYGKLIKKRFDEDLFIEVKDSALSFNNLDGTDVAYLLYAAEGKEPEDTGKVKIRYSTTDNGIPPIEQEIKIVPNPTYPIRVTMEPNQLMPGDTSLITIERRVEEYPYSEPWNYTYEPFEPDQLFDVNIGKGGEYGTILSANGVDTSDVFTQIGQGFRFIAKDTINATSAEISIRVRTVIYNFDELNSPSQNSKANNVSKYKNKNSTAIVFFPSSSEEIFGIGKATISNDGIEIMLGETKYFQAKQNNSTNEIKIEEVEPDASGVPAQKTGTEGDWTWITTDEWDSPPLRVDTVNSTGERLGVFYDRFYATVHTTGETRPQRHDIDEGLIRIIGRFWAQDSTYESWLSLTYEERADSVKIKTIKPGRLGAKDSTVTGPVNNVTWNLDSLIIETAGKTGILPQIIKGIIKTESVNFNPSYRYEPFQDMYTRGIRAHFDSTHRYWINSETNLGDPTIPDHNNIYIGTGAQINGYPGYKVVWDYYSEYDSSLYSPNIYKTEKERLEGFYKSKIDSIKIANSVDSTTAAPIAKPLAERSYKSYLKYEIGGIGMNSTIAQTRIAASYGLMQLTYYSGVSKFRRTLVIYNYPNNNANYLPESINIPDINIKYGTYHFLGNLRNALGTNITYTEVDTWPASHFLERSYWHGLRGYNGGSKYPNKVFLNSENYLPVK